MAVGGGGVDSTEAPPPAPPAPPVTLSQLEIAPSSATLDVGQLISFQVTAVSSDGTARTLSGLTFSYDTTFLSLSSDGQFRTRRGGQTVVTAMYEGAAVSATVTIRPGATAFPAPPEADRDGDGVPDAKDHCPDRPAGARNDGFGCPRSPCPPGTTLVRNGTACATESAAAKADTHTVRLDPAEIHFVLPARWRVDSTAMVVALLLRDATFPRVVISATPENVAPLPVVSGSVPGTLSEVVPTQAGDSARLCLQIDSVWFRLGSGVERCQIAGVNPLEQRRFNWLVTPLKSGTHELLLHYETWLANANHLPRLDTTFTISVAAAPVSGVTVVINAIDRSKGLLVSVAGLFAALLAIKKYWEDIKKWLNRRRGRRRGRTRT
jgi:hypothetical protein